MARRIHMEFKCPCSTCSMNVVSCNIMVGWVSHLVWVVDGCRHVRANENNCSDHLHYVCV